MIPNICKRCPHYKTCEQDCAFVAKLKQISKNICDTCPHKKTCDKPCYLAHCLLNEHTKNPSGEVKKTVIRNGKRTKILVVWPEMSVGVYRYGEKNPQGEKQKTVEGFSQEDMTDFWEGVFYPKSKMLGTFVDKFFNQLSDKEISEKYDVRLIDISKIYSRAKNRILEIIQAVNHEKFSIKKRKQAKSHMGNISHLSKKTKVFLLYHCFGLSYAEIAEILGYKTTGNISRSIKDLEGQIKKGLNIIEFDKEFKPKKLSTWEKRHQKRYTKV